MKNKVLKNVKKQDYKSGLEYEIAKTLASNINNINGFLDEKGMNRFNPTVKKLAELTEGYITLYLKGLVKARNA